MLLATVSRSRLAGDARGDRRSVLGRSLGEQQGEASPTSATSRRSRARVAFTVSRPCRCSRRSSATTSRILYVAENHSTDVSSLAWLYKISGVWAGREGSLLFWAWLIAIFAAYVAYKRMDKTDELSNMGLHGHQHRARSCSPSAMIFSEPNNPFKATPAECSGPNGELSRTANWGMNPLLQHWAMILHPPTLFIGYAGLTIPFAFAIAALIVNDRLEALGRDRRPHHGVLVAVPRHRHRPGLDLGLRRAGLGWLLGVGPGRERLAAAVAHRRRPDPQLHGLPPA